MTRFKKMTFQGKPVWFPVEFSENFAIPLAHHVKPDGSDLDFPACFDGPSFGHAYRDGDRFVVSRFGHKVGTTSDAREGWDHDPV